MTIDIDRLTEAELIDLNHRIVARLRFLHQMRAHAEMLEFKIGDRVTFQSPGQGQIEGMVTRYNRKTVTVITDDGRQWNVSPQLLSKAVSPGRARADGSNIVLLNKL
ncbi:MAG: mechanosensitive ion channel domain-containing protein [Rhodopila sp.]